MNRLSKLLGHILLSPRPIQSSKRLPKQEETSVLNKIVLGVIGISAAAILMSMSVKYKNRECQTCAGRIRRQAGEVERLLTEGIDVNTRAATTSRFDGGIQQRSHRR